MQDTRCAHRSRMSFGLALEVSGSLKSVGRANLSQSGRFYIKHSAQSSAPSSLHLRHWRAHGIPEISLR